MIQQELAFLAMQGTNLQHQKHENCCGSTIGSTVKKCYYCTVYADISDCDDCFCHFVKCSVTGVLCYKNYKDEPSQPVNICTCDHGECIVVIAWTNDQSKTCNLHPLTHTTTVFSATPITITDTSASIEHEHSGQCLEPESGCFKNKCYWCVQYADISDCDDCECRIRKCIVTGKLCYNDYKMETVKKCTCGSEISWYDNAIPCCNIHPTINVSHVPDLSHTIYISDSREIRSSWSWSFLGSLSFLKQKFTMSTKPNSNVRCF